jgi:hypothetical protein
LASPAASMLRSPIVPAYYVKLKQKEQQLWNIVWWTRPKTASWESSCWDTCVPLVFNYKFRGFAVSYIQSQSLRRCGPDNLSSVLVEINNAHHTVCCHEFGWRYMPICSSQYRLSHFNESKKPQTHTNKKITATQNALCWSKGDTWIGFGGLGFHHNRVNTQINSRSMGY